MEGESYADFAFFEDDDEVFAIVCSIDYGEYVNSYSCLKISAFKKSGNWPTVLLEYYEQIQIEQNRLVTQMRSFRDLKSRPNTFER